MGEFVICIFGAAFGCVDDFGGNPRFSQVRKVPLLRED